MGDCVFCRDLPKVMENDLAYVVYDLHPLTKGHTLVIVKRHIEQIFEATAAESEAVKDLISRMKAELDRTHVPDGYNIMINCGKAAGQVVMHAHVHLLPRYTGVAIHIREHLKGNIE